MTEGISTRHIRLYERSGRFVIFNPTVPSWAYTNGTGAVLIRLVSQCSSIEAATRIATSNGIDAVSCEKFFEKMISQKIFEDAGRSGRWTDEYVRHRKLSSIYLHLTNKCNLSCAYCYRNSSPKIRIKHFGDEFISFLDQCVPILGANPVMTFSGGEPMIHPDFFQVAKHAKALGFSNHLLTNGIFISVENAEEIGHSFDYVKISLDGASEATHAATRGIGNFDAVIGGIRLLSSACEKLSVAVQMTMTLENMRECSMLSSLLPANVECRFTPLMPMGRGLQGERYLGNDEFLDVYRRTSSEDAREGSTIEIGKRSHGCYAGDAHISIADTGDVYPCHLFHQTSFKMGNIFNDTIEDIFFGESMTTFGRSMDVENNNERCSSCDFRYLCGGGCKANPLHRLGDYRKSDTYCEFIRNSNLDKMFAGYSQAI